jgi:hypothetical protein
VPTLRKPRRVGQPLYGIVRTNISEYWPPAMAGSIRAPGSIGAEGSVNEVGIPLGAGQTATPRCARWDGPFDFAQGRLRPSLHVRGLREDAESYVAC